MKNTLKTIGALALIVTLFTIGYAAIIIGDDGMGFVGKGDVQLGFGWNNAQLQACATIVGCLKFDYASTSTEVSEVSWECTNSNNQKIQERERTTTTTTTTGGIFNSVARVKNQVTGFNLNGFDPNTLVNSSSSSADGPAINSCPNSNGTWSLTTPAGAPVVSTSGSGRNLTVTDTRSGGSSFVVDLDAQ